jgi:hypothetical protein
MRKIGIIGLEHKAESMIRLIRKAKKFEITGIYDAHEQRLNKLADQFQIPATNNPFGLIAASDLLIISKTNDDSFNLIIESILNSKHVIIDNPIKINLPELNELIKLSAEASVSVIPFLPYSFSSCLINTKSYIFNPTYVELRNKCIPESKTTHSDFSEKLLNIIDITLNLVKANVIRTHENAVKVVGHNPQLVNIRIEFDNGCIASIILDYFTNREELTVNVFQNQQIVSIDLVKNYAVIRSYNQDSLLNCDITKPVVSKDENPYAEILNYLHAFENYNTPVSMLENFKNTLSIFHKITEKFY